MAAYQDLELLVAKIQGELAPDAKVLHNVKLPGRLSGQQRQIDVLVQQQIGQYEMRIVLECKDLARPVDVKGVEEFHGLLVDVGGHRGALVSPRGFTQAAKARAGSLQLDLYSPIDTDPHKWQARVTAPMICDFRSAALQFRFVVSSPGPFTIPTDFLNAVAAFDDKGNRLGIPAEVVVKKWNEGRYPVEPGVHEDLPIFETATVRCDNGHGWLAPIKLTVTLHVERQLFFGHLPISQISGFKDELSGAVITNAFTSGIFDFDDVMQNWQRIDSEEQLPVRPLMRLKGLMCWPEEE